MDSSLKHSQIDDLSDEAEGENESENEDEEMLELRDEYEEENEDEQPSTFENDLAQRTFDTSQASQLTQEDTQSQNVEAEDLIGDTTETEQNGSAKIQLNNAKNSNSTQAVKSRKRKIPLRTYHISIIPQDLLKLEDASNFEVVQQEIKEKVIRKEYREKFKLYKYPKWSPFEAYIARGTITTGYPDCMNYLGLNEVLDSCIDEHSKFVLKKIQKESGEFYWVDDDDRIFEDIKTWTIIFINLPVTENENRWFIVHFNAGHTIINKAKAIVKHFGRTVTLQSIEEISQIEASTIGERPAIRKEQTAKGLITIDFDEILMACRGKTAKIHHNFVSHVTGKDVLIAQGSSDLQKLPDICLWAYNTSMLLEYRENIAHLDNCKPVEDKEKEKYLDSKLVAVLGEMLPMFEDREKLHEFAESRNLNFHWPAFDIPKKIRYEKLQKNRPDNGDFYDQLYLPDYIEELGNSKAENNRPLNYHPTYLLDHKIVEYEGDQRKEIARSIKNCLCYVYQEQRKVEEEEEIIKTTETTISEETRKNSPKKSSKKKASPKKNRRSKTDEMVHIGEEKVKSSSPILKYFHYGGRWYEVIPKYEKELDNVYYDVLDNSSELRNLLPEADHKIFEDEENKKREVIEKLKNEAKEKGKEFNKEDIPEELKPMYFEQWYNIMVGKTINNVLCLDRKCVKQIEICDLFSHLRHLIHVKVSHSAPETSYVCHQGFVSAQLLKFDEVFRSLAIDEIKRNQESQGKLINFKDLIPLPLNPDEHFKPSMFTVVLAIISTKDFSPKKKPPFSLSEKIALFKAVNIIRKLGYQVKLIGITYKNKPVREKDKAKKRIQITQYCVCNNPKNKNKTFDCPNKACVIKQFHYTCVGLNAKKEVPEGWLCKYCKKDQEDSNPLNRADDDAPMAPLSQAETVIDDSVNIENDQSDCEIPTLFLSNSRTDCFANAGIQLLRHIPNIVNYFKTSNLNDVEFEKNRDRANIIEVRNDIKKILDSLGTNNLCNVSELRKRKFFEAPIPPSSDIYGVLSKKRGYIDPNVQHCALEFVTLIMGDILPNDVLSCIAFEETQKIRCSNNHESTQKFSHKILSLSLGDRVNYPSIESLIQIEMQEEWIEDHRCDMIQQCDSTRSRKSIDYCMNNNRFLLIAFKSVQQDGDDYVKVSLKFDSYEVDNIKIGDFKWKIIGAIEHRGMNYNSGHYITWLRDTAGHFWIFNDDQEPRQSKIKDGFEDLYVMLLEKQVDDDNTAQ